MGVKGLNGDIVFDDVAVNNATEGLYRRLLIEAISAEQMHWDL